MSIHRQEMIKSQGKKSKLPTEHTDVSMELTASAHNNDWQNGSSEVHSTTPEIDVPDQKQETDTNEDSDHARNTSLKHNRRIVDAIDREVTAMVTTVNEDEKIDPLPIVGYADEPLVPLSKACAPLMSLLHDLPHYIQMAIDETADEPPDGLTIDESAAIRLYTIEWEKPHRSLYSMLNHTLKKDSRERLQPYFRYMKLFLTALVKLPCLPQTIVWRGVTKNFSADFPPGTPVTWWGFSSCTTELTVLDSNLYLGSTGDRTLFSVEVVNGRSIRDHSHFVTEDEILMLPGTHMVVQTQFSPAADLYIIHLKQMIPEEVLLEPPFEGT